MQRDHIVDGFWHMPGRPQGDWPGTKNGRDHRVALSEFALEMIEVHLATAQQRPDVQPCVGWLLPVFRSWSTVLTKETSWFW